MQCKSKGDFDVMQVSDDDNRQSEEDTLLSKMESFLGFAVHFENNHNEVVADRSFESELDVEQTAPLGRENAKSKMEQGILNTEVEQVAPLGRGILKFDVVQENPCSELEQESPNAEVEQVAPLGQDLGRDPLFLSEGVDYRQKAEKILGELKDLHNRCWGTFGNAEAEATIFLDLLIISQRANLVKKEIAEVFRRDIVRRDLHVEDLALEFVSAKINPRGIDGALNKYAFSDRFVFTEGILRWKLTSEKPYKYCALQIVQNEFFFEYVTQLDFQEKALIQKYERIRVDFMRVTAYLKNLLNLFFDTLDSEAQMETFLKRVWCE